MRARTLVIRSDDLSLEGELVEPDRYDRVALLCHGIPGGGPPDPSDDGYAGLARAMAGRGTAAVWFNFRGARSAPGDFSIAGWCRDLHAAIDAVRAHTDAPIVLVGSSAGGTCAIRVAAERPDVHSVATFAAAATFDDLASDARDVLHRFRNIGIIRDPAFPADADAWGAEFREISGLAAVGAIAPRPLLIVHGDADDVVPYAHAEQLFEKAGEPKELARLPRGGHQLRRDPRALDALFDWFDRHPASPGAA